MKFVDRTQEISRLRKSINSGKSELIVLYGRRRVGKSSLVKQVLNAETDVYFQADETQISNQLYLLAKSIGLNYPGFDHVVYPDWNSLLESYNYRANKNSTLCLDEFPYLVKSFPALPSVLQHFWDTCKPSFNLILCGSSQQSMYSDVLNEKSPLYGRADCIIKLQPISMYYMQQAMGQNKPADVIIEYSFWGGVPRYWELAEKEDNFKEALKHLLLSPDGTLADEPNRLLRDEMRDLILSRSLLSTIGNGVNRLSEIASRLNKNTTELTGPVRRLVDMGLIYKETPFGESEKNSKHTLYKIKDSFMDAYYHFVAPNASLVALGREEAVWDIVEQSINSYVANHWETFCREAVSGNIVDGIRYGLSSRWWGTCFNKETKEKVALEIDVISESIDKKHLLIGECKWTASEDADRLLSELKRKAELLPFINGRQIHYALFLKEEPANGGNGRIFIPEDIIRMSQR